MQELYKKLAKAYYEFLISIDWFDPVFMKGINEGKNKFLSNAWLGSFVCNKYHKAHYASKNALDKMRAKDHSNLIFEHIIPKQQYIQEPCERLAKEKNLSVDVIEDLLMRYWYIATITKGEDSQLNTRELPAMWDGKDIFIRYKMADIQLMENPYFQYSNLAKLG